MENKSALLFINGNPPTEIPNLEGYYVIACSDGAFHYLKELKFPLERLDFISGDFDSSSEILHDFNSRKIQEEFKNLEIHYTPDQEKTDFEKALKILYQKGAKKVDVYGGSGGEMDHFLGNLTSVFQFKDKMKIQFFDEFSTYFFAEKHLILDEVKGKMISLYPFPIAENLSTKGMNWELENENLKMTSRNYTRNFAVENEVEISFESGDLLVFVGKNYQPFQGFKP